MTGGLWRGGSGPGGLHRIIHICEIFLRGPIASQGRRVLTERFDQLGDQRAIRGADLARSVHGEVAEGDDLALVDCAVSPAVHLGRQLGGGEERLRLRWAIFEYGD